MMGLSPLELAVEGVKIAMAMYLKLGGDPKQLPVIAAESCAARAEVLAQQTTDEAADQAARPKGPKL